MTDIRVLVDGRVDEAADMAAALRVATEQRGVAWFDVRLDDEAAIAHLADTLGWKTAVTGALRSARKRARLEVGDDHTIVVLRPARYLDDSESVELSSLGVVAAAGVIVTIRGDAWVDLSHVREFLSAHRGLGESADGVLWAVCASTIDQYGPVIAGVEDDIDEIEEQLFDGSSEVSRRIFALQRELVGLQHATEPLPEMMDQLAETLDGGRSRILAPRFRTTSDSAEHVLRRVTGFRSTLDNALTVHATLVGEQSTAEMQRMTELSIRQNDQVKKISSWAAIGFAPSLVAGIYGMNFRNMPELLWPWGYPFALALMLAVAGGLYWVFKRHDWL